MPRFYFNVVDGVGTATDEEGLELHGMAAVRSLAVQGARDIMASEVRLGSIDLTWRIVVTDEAGGQVLSMPFSEAVTVTANPD